MVPTGKGCEMNVSVTEPERQTPVIGTWDVVVIGGGIAGVSAAVAAARQGSRVALIEKEFGLGGLATLANIMIFLPLCDGCGRQVIAGIGEELLRLSVKDVKTCVDHQNLRPIPACWRRQGPLAERRKHRYLAAYNPPSFQFELEALIGREKIDLFYDTRLCGGRLEGNALTHVLVENKSGRLALAGKTFIDASGDADLCAYAGCATDDLDGNVLCGWYYMLHNDILRYVGYTNPYSNTFDKTGKGPYFSGIRGKDVTAQMLGSRKAIWKRIQAERRKHPGDTIYPVMIPTIPGFRATRRLDGAATLTDSDRHHWFSDTVGLTGDWRARGPVWALPYGTIRSDRVVNLFAAGRCISADRSVWDVTRVIPTCAVTGEAAGVAAALAAERHHGDGRKVDVARLQDTLKSAGVLLDPGLAIAVC